MKLKEILMVEKGYNEMIDDHYLEVYVDAIKNEEVLLSRSIYVRRGEDGFYIFTVDFGEEKESENVQRLIESIVMHKEVRTKVALLSLNEYNVSKKDYFIKHGEKLNK